MIITGDHCQQSPKKALNFRNKLLALIRWEILSRICVQERKLQDISPTIPVNALVRRPYIRLEWTIWKFVGAPVSEASL